MARLKDLDSKTWGRYWHIFRPLRDVPGDPKRAKVIMEHTLQGVIQDAIVNRGWIWELSSESWEDKTIRVASIYKSGPGYDGDYYTDNHWYLLNESVAETPAKAILTAYIAVMEAQT